MEFLKELVDGLNCDHFRDTGTAPRAEIDHLRDFGRSIARMTFYDSVAVMEFMNVPRRLRLSANIQRRRERVMPLSKLFTVGARSFADTRLVGRTAARHIDRILLGQRRGRRGFFEAGFSAWTNSHTVVTFSPRSAIRPPVRAR